MQYTREQLQQIADDAHNRIRETYALFDTPGEPPQISAGMVKCVLEASASLAIPLIPPEPTLRLEPHEPTPQPERKPFHFAPERKPEKPEPTPEKQKSWHVEPRRNVSDEEALSFIRNLSGNSILPSSRTYNVRRPAGYPSSTQLTRRLNCRWLELADLLDLTVSDNQRAGAEGGKRRWSNHKHANGN